MASPSGHKSCGLAIHLVALVAVCLLLAVHPVAGQRLSRLWWNELKPANSTSTSQARNTLIAPEVVSAVPETFASAIAPIEEPSSIEGNSDSDASALTDDELVSEASRMNSKMVRTGRKSSKGDLSSKFIRRATQFDDTAEQDVFEGPGPASTAAASNQFMKRSGFSGFQNDRQARSNGGSRDNIWSYFDDKMSGGKQSSWKGNQRDSARSGFSDLSTRFNSRGPSNNIPDDYISRQFDKRQNGGSTSNRPSGFSSSKKPGATDERVVPFTFNRKKNPEEKEEWRQLIQSIFDSSPRSTPSSYPGARVHSKSKFADLPFNYGTEIKPKVRPETMNSLNSGKSKAKVDDDDEDVLKDEREENVDLKDKISEEEEEEDEEGSANPQLPPDDDSKEDEALDTGNKKRQTQPEIAQEDEDEEEEEDPTEEDNQYLRSGKSNSTAGVANIGNGSAKRSASSGSDSGKNFGARINRSNSTAPKSPGRKVQTEKPKFTMHFQLGKSVTTTTESAVNDQLITALENDPAFAGNGSPTTSYGSAATTTSSPFEFPSTERFDVLDTSTEEDDLFERSQPVNRDRDISTTVAVTTTTESPKRSAPTGKSKTKTGKWMDNETFRLNDDRSMIMLPEDEEDEPENFSDEDEHSLNEVPSGLFNRNVLNARRNRMASIPIAPPKPKPILTKRKLITQSRRPVRQDDNSDSDDISRLAKALPGTPGQDYPLFGVIPRTGFNCQDHKWPGYYADTEAGCQVFHICQTGGRKNSFLCPNGTLFNQQLFVCDWWHNVQCDQVVSHYELNANIYDYNWESKRMKSSSKNQKRSSERMGDFEILKRVGELKPSGNDSADLVATTTVSSLDDLITTTEPSNTLFTESVFGPRSKDSEESEPKKKRAVSGIKGGKQVKFNRINALPTNKKSNTKSALAISTTASFLDRYKFASHQQVSEVEKPAKVIHAKLVAAPNSVSSTFRSRLSSSASASSVPPFSHLPFTSHLSSSSSLHRTKHYRA